MGERARWASNAEVSQVRKSEPGHPVPFLGVGPLGCKVSRCPLRRLHCIDTLPGANHRGNSDEMKNDNRAGTIYRAMTRG
jgi:hypothetical protein